ncbi:MAG: alanine racemase [Clostridia bacterium]|nr:alanine racemase [Clostridia bacterium]
MLPSRVYAEIDLDAMESNMNQIINKVKPAKVMAVIKADAYGHGALRTVQELSRMGVYAFSVATAEEALTLRREGVTEPILILGYVFEDSFDELIINNIDLTLFDMETALLLQKHAERLRRTVLSHIKVDTGMGRLGLQPTAESVEIIKQIAELPNIKIDGMFTHFACADSKNKESVNKQIEIFTSFVNSVKGAGVNIPLVHCCNSAGIIEFPKPLFDMVRCGIIAYGLYPSEEVNKDSIKLTPVMSIKSRISFVKKVSKGFTVSYGSTFVADKDMEIATIPVGYADGYPRLLSNKGRVIINGRYANIIGRVCMDQFMVDVTGFDAKRGDTVILMGTDGENTVSAEEIGDISGRFNYELICDINKRVPRVYIQNGKVVSVVAALV